MNCPACNHTLTVKTVDNVTAEVCRDGCGGVWFDWYELKKVDEPHEKTGEAFLDIERNPDIKVDTGSQRKCPKCTDTVMMRHFFTTKLLVPVDECPKCGGFWLDTGELKAIRELFDSAEDKDKAAEAYVAQNFDKAMLAADDKHRKDIEKFKASAKALRYLYPSYWIPGKQPSAMF